MDHEQHDQASEPQELGVASIETRGGGWPIPETDGYRMELGLSEQ